MDKIRTTPTTSTSEEQEEADTEAVAGDTTTEAVEVVYPSAEVFTSIEAATDRPEQHQHHSTAGDRPESPAVIQPTLSTGPLTTFEDINAFLFHPPTTSSGPEEVNRVSQDREFRWKILVF